MAFPVYRSVSLALLLCCYLGLITASLSLSQPRSGFAIAAVASKIVFAGGNPATKRVDIFDSQTLQRTIASLSVSRTRIAGAGIAGKALFGGGDFAQPRISPSNVV